MLAQHSIIPLPYFARPNKTRGVFQKLGECDPRTAKVADRSETADFL